MTDASERARALAHRAYYEIPASSVRPVQEVLAEKIAAALAAEREKAEQDARKDAAQFVRECLQEHVDEWVIALVEQGVLMRRPATGGSK